MMFGHLVKICFIKRFLTINLNCSDLCLCYKLFPPTFLWLDGIRLTRSSRVSALGRGQFWRRVAPIYWQNGVTESGDQWLTSTKVQKLASRYGIDDILAYDDCSSKPFFLLDTIDWIDYIFAKKTLYCDIFTTDVAPVWSQSCLLYRFIKIFNVNVCIKCYIFVLHACLWNVIFTSVYFSYIHRCNVNSLLYLRMLMWWRKSVSSSILLFFSLKVDWFMHVMFKRFGTRARTKGKSSGSIQTMLRFGLSVLSLATSFTISRNSKPSEVGREEQWDQGITPWLDVSVEAVCTGRGRGGKSLCRELLHCSHMTSNGMEMST